MSRVNDFTNHQFFTEWMELKNTVNSEEINDRTVLVVVEEFSRLRKIIGYLDGIISTLDPELTPIKILQYCLQETTACRTNLQNYGSNKTPHYLTQANENADNLFSYVKPYSIAPQNIKRGLQRAYKGYVEMLSEYVSTFQARGSELLAEIDRLRIESEEQSGRIKQINTSIVELEADIFGEDIEDNGIQGRIGAFVKNIEEKNNEISNIYNELIVGNDETPSVKKSIAQARESLMTVLAESRQKIKELSEFHEEIYGELDETGDRAGGVLNDFNLRVSELETFEQRQADRYKALNEQIESLLPGATSAGLATAYRTMKENFDQPIKHMSWLFYSAIVGLCFISFYFFIYPGNESSVLYNDWSAILRALIHKIPIYIPILWLAFYASKRRSESQRLQQEYAHKEALAKSYDSYKKQLEQLGDENQEMLRALIAGVMGAIAYNPAITLDGKHGDKMPVENLISGVFNRLVSKKELQK